MGISTKCVCLTDNKNVFEVAQLIENEIKTLLKTSRSLTVRIDSENLVQGMELSATSEMVTINFRYKGEQRALCVHFGCDCDASEVSSSKKIICSLGYWGESQSIIDACARALATLGEVFVQYEDCSSPFQPWAD